MGRQQIFDVPKLFFTNDDCRFDRLPRPGVGLLVDQYGIPVYPVLRWLITQRKRKGDPRDTGTIKQQAFDLRMFWEFLQRERIDWIDVTDNHLLLWRDRMFGGHRISKEQKQLLGKNANTVAKVSNDLINRRLTNVFRFYLSCAEKDLVPEYTIGHGGPFRITVEYSKDNKRKWFGLLRSEAPLPATTPDDAALDKLHDTIDKIFSPDVAMRNRLYVDWNRYLGLRGMEAASLKITMIPATEEIEKYLNTENPYPMDFSPKRQGVRTKGGSSRKKPLDVDPMLLQLTRNYIDFYRPAIVERAKRRFGRAYKEPDALFLGTTGKGLGRPIQTKTMQQAIGKALSAAGIDATPHALRRMFAMSVVENLYLGKFLELSRKKYDPHQIVATIDDNSIIIYASQQLGHRQAATTLKSYLDHTKLKLLMMSEGGRMAYLEQRRMFAESAYKHYKTEIPGKDLEKPVMQGYVRADQDGLRDAVQRGDKDEAWRILQQHLGSPH